MSMSNREARLEKLWACVPQHERWVVERYLEDSERYSIDLRTLSEDAQAYIRLYKSE